MRKIISLILSICFIFQQTGLAQAAAVELNLSGYFARMGSGLSPVDAFRPVHLRYFSYDTLNNSFRVLLDKGDFEESLPKGAATEARLKNQAKELLNYFLIGLTLPNDKFWVNLRPDSPNQIIDFNLEETDIGKVMLEADLQLKKDTAAFTSPRTPEGKEYWDKLYKKAAELYGSENVTIPTLTRPWIVPNEIIIRETKDSAYIYKATLKVMLEQDYLKDSSAYSFKDSRSKALNEYSSQLIRELIIPKLSKEVNTAKRYAPLRQVYYSLILSRWFKLRYKGQSGTYPSLIDKNNLTNLTSKTPWDKKTYFEAYKKSFAEGEYNIKEPVYTPTGQVIRSYVSGGIEAGSTLTQAAKNGINVVGGGYGIVKPLRRNIDMIYFYGNGANLTLQEDTGSSALEEKVLSLIKRGDLAEGIRLFTQSRTEFNPPQIDNINEAIEENYQGPLDIVGKIGGTSVAFEGANADGLLGFRASEKTFYSEDDSSEEVLGRIVSAISRIIDRYGEHRIRNIYTSAPGFFKPDGTLLEDEANIPCIKAGFSFEKAITERLNARYPGRASLGGFSVKVVHDATAGYLGEASTFGSYPGGQDMYFIIAGTGIGTRRAVDGQPFDGGEEVSYQHNEGPHHLHWNGDTQNPDYTYHAIQTKGYSITTIFPQGQDLEDRTRGGAIASYAQEVISDVLAKAKAGDNLRDAKDLLSRANGDISQLSTEILGHAANAGNKLAKRIIQERARELGIGLAVLIMESHKQWGDKFGLPEHIIIGSGVAQIGDIFLEGVKEGASQRFSPEYRFLADRFELSKIKDDTGRELLGGLPTHKQLEDFGKNKKMKILRLINGRTTKEVREYYEGLRPEDRAKIFDMCADAKDGFELVALANALTSLAGRKRFFGAVAKLPAANDDPRKVVSINNFGSFQEEILSGKVLVKERYGTFQYFNEPRIAILRRIDRTEWPGESSSPAEEEKVTLHNDTTMLKTIYEDIMERLKMANLLFPEAMSQLKGKCENLNIPMDANNIAKLHGIGLVNEIGTPYQDDVAPIARLALKREGRRIIIVPPLKEESSSSPETEEMEVLIDRNLRSMQAGQARTALSQLMQELSQGRSDPSFSIEAWRSKARSILTRLGIPEPGITSSAVEVTFKELPSRLLIMITEARNNAIALKATFRVTLDGYWVETFVLSDDADTAVRIILDKIKNLQGAERLKYKVVNGNALDRSYSGNDVVITPADNSSSPVGGIDFKHKALADATTYEAVGSFAGLDFSLPKLSSSALLSFNLDKEEVDITQAINNGILVSGQRIKEFMAASFAKGEMEQRRETVITWLAKLGILEESQCCNQESSREYREALVIADSVLI